MIEKLEAIEICFGLFLLYSGIEGRYYLKLQICTEVFPYFCWVNKIRVVVLTKYVCL